MMECWTCGSRSHSDNNCPYRITRLRVVGAAQAARDVKRPTVKKAASVPPRHANAQVRGLANSSSPNPNVHRSSDDPNGPGTSGLNGSNNGSPNGSNNGSSNGSNNGSSNGSNNGSSNGSNNGSLNGSGNGGLNGSGKSPRQRLSTIGGEQQSQKGTSSERRHVLSSNQRTRMAPTAAESEESLSRNYTRNTIVNGQRNKSTSNGDGRPLGYASSSPPRGTLRGASSFDNGSLVDALRRRAIAGPVTRRAGYLEYRKAFIGCGVGGQGDLLAGGSFVRTPQGEMTHRKRLEASSGVRQRGRRGQRRRPMRISGDVVAYQAAKHAVEDLLAAPPLLIGVVLLAFAFAISASSRALLTSLWSIVLSLGVTLWIRADVPTRSQRASSLHLGTNRWPRRAQPWVEVEVGDDGVEGRTGKVRGGTKGVLSAMNTRRLVMALVMARFAVDAVSVFWFFRIAIRTESPWLALVLFQASALYAVSKGAAVAARGKKELRCGTHFRYLVASWHTFLFVASVFEAVVASLPSSWLYGAALREGVGSALVGVAGWQLSKVSEHRVEQACRYGLVASLEKVLKNADGRELSKEAMLELAFFRWLVDYWSKPPSFSAPEMCCMLAQATTSVASRGGSPRMSPVGVRDGSSTSPPAEACTSGSVVALTECLYGRTGKPPPSKRLETALETLNPSWWSCVSLLLVMRCPSLCALPVLVFYHALWGPSVSWTAGGFVLALLAGPVGVEGLRLKLMMDEMCGSKAGEMVSFGTDSSSNDSLSFLLRRTNQGLSSVLVNARCALEILQKFLREKENGGGGGGGNATGNKAAVSSVTLTKSPDHHQQQPKQHVVFHDKTRTFRDVEGVDGIGKDGVDGIGKDGVERSASWIARESSSPQMSYYRSVENTTSPGRLSSSRTNNSLGLTREPPPSPKPSTTAAATVVGVDDRHSRREDHEKTVISEPELTLTGTSITTSKDGSRKGENGVGSGTSEEILKDQGSPSLLSSAALPLESRGNMAPVEAVHESGDGDEDWISGAGHAIVGTTLAVVGVADDLMGTIKDAAGGAVGSIQVLAGVFGLFGVGEEQQ